MLFQFQWSNPDPYVHWVYWCNDVTEIFRNLDFFFFLICHRSWILREMDRAIACTCVKFKGLFLARVVCKIVRLTMLDFWASWFWWTFDCIDHVLKIVICHTLAQTYLLSNKPSVLIVVREIFYILSVGSRRWWNTVFIITWQCFTLLLTGSL